MQPRSAAGRRRPAGSGLLAGWVLVLASTLGAGAATATGPGLQPAKGRFLIAERDLRDPNFAETVVLLTAYDEAGAMGLIVNWPTAAPAAELIPEVEGIERRSDTVYVGGPVARQLLLMLVRSETDLEQAERVFGDVHLSTSSELLRRLVSGQVEVSEFRLYSGYAGWAAGQLDRELAVGGWKVLPAESDLVFGDDPDSVWPLLIERGDVKWTQRLDTAALAPAP